ncbi:MAG: hypothetical protein Ct9H300mP19_01790 [Dehalococcoidia bacterium]|nr:MAG: hypothetical protein Ct9H300mP19_01790 [Dehalococcoidia bacterium]
MVFPRIAISTGVPVVPVSLTGSENLQNPLKVLKPTATLRLKIGKPFVATGSDVGTPRSIAADVTTEIMSRISRMLPEAQRGEYADVTDMNTPNTLDYVHSSDKEVT